MSIKLSLFRNAGAGVWSKISVVIFRLVQVPCLLYFLGVEEYGRWLVLYSLPSWLNLTNLGFGTVAANEMSIAVSSGNLDDARKSYSTTQCLIIIISVVGASAIILASSLIPIYKFLGVSPTRHSEVSRAIIYLSLSVFVTFFYDTSLGRFRAAHKTHLSVITASFFPWLDLLSMLFVLNFTKRFDNLALGILTSTLVCCLIYQWFSRTVLPGIYFSIKYIERKKFKSLFKKGIAFQAFPLGNALLFQGSIMIVQAVLGPASVTVFGTVRTLVRTVNQAMELINASIWPEISHLFGINDLVKAARLHRTSVFLSIIISSFGALTLIFFGQSIYRLWLGKSIILPNHILIVFLLPIPFNVLWYTSSVVHMATNQHEGLAKRYFFATCVSMLSCVVLSKIWGIQGAALSTVVADIILIPYVISKSLLITGDTWKGFLRGFWDLPELFTNTLKMFRKA